ncbi:MAG: DbpA RNA binding domain-containing protein [Gammaproteobacteria bacterium]|nr:DbpA RNA binding domain-containing protein [Gammaproteobacteria bacterium]
MPASSVGKIDLFDRQAYVAIERAQLQRALTQLNKGKLKGRAFRARALQ